MTAYELAEKRNKLQERADYLSDCINKLESENPCTPITLTRSKVEEIKLDYYGHIGLINDELKHR